MPISLRIFYTIKDFGIVSKAEVDVFLELFFSNDWADVGNLISGSSTFSKSIGTWPGMEKFEHYFASV